MKNKYIAIFGIVAYILSVFASAENLKGDPTAPVLLVIISGIAFGVFVLVAVLRLWKTKRKLSLVFLGSTIAVSVLPVLGSEWLVYGSVPVLILSFFKIVYLLAYVWVLVSLFQKSDT